MKEKRSFKKNSDGIWEKDGVLFPFVTKIKADRCLKSEEFRNDFHPNVFVNYSLEMIYQDELPDGSHLSLAMVSKVEEGAGKFYPIPLCLLDFSESQQLEIMAVKEIKAREFKKGTSMIKEDFPSEEINSFVEENTLVDPEEYYIKPTFSERFYGIAEIHSIYSV